MLLISSYVIVTFCIRDCDMNIFLYPAISTVIQGVSKVCSVTVL